MQNKVFFNAVIDEIDAGASFQLVPEVGKYFFCFATPRFGNRREQDRGIVACDILAQTQSVQSVLLQHTKRCFE